MVKRSGPLKVIFIDGVMLNGTAAGWERDARFTSPSSQNVSVPGFYYRDFEYDVTGGQRETLTPTGNWSWRVVSRRMCSLRT
jgi:hypothetical protein